jgi:hypothetical protein
MFATYGQLLCVPQALVKQCMQANMLLLLSNNKSNAVVVGMMQIAFHSTGPHLIQSNRPNVAAVFHV